MNVDGSPALVTGGASGLGAATARHLHARGAGVVVFDRDAERAKALVAELGDRAMAAIGDVTSEEDTAAAVEAATELGGLRMVVACAGGAKASGRIIDRHGTPHDLQGFVDTVQLNLVGTFNTVRLAA